jgi:hypothetical protein
MLYLNDLYVTTAPLHNFLKLVRRCSTNSTKFLKSASNGP